MASNPPSSPRRPRSRWVAGLVLVYLALLAVSHGVRWSRAPDVGPRPGDAMETVQGVDGDLLLDEEVSVVYREAGEPTAETLLLLHGSPGSKGDFDRMIDVLARRYRVIAPDLPGFGRSTSGLPDYSIRAHARHVRQLMDRLEVADAHVVGFSMGGGVAIDLYDIAPERVRSMVLLSAIGVQEFELFGSYRLNHLVHGAQVAGLWLVREMVPHMGALDDAVLSVEYARNFYDTDQRPLRAILERIETPVLILHGETDFLVLPEAAVEHHRIVPQSELVMTETGHFMVFLEGSRTATTVLDFVERVDGGEVPRRADASPDRLAAATRPFDLTSVPPFSGFALILMLALISLATLISEDLTCIGAGLLVAQGRIDFVPAVFACFLGIFVGDLLLYLAGRWLGRAALHRAPLCWLVSAESVEQSSIWFERRGPIVIGLSRFIPGTRLPTYLAAGMLRTSAVGFIFYFFLAVALWTPLLVAFAMLLGDRAFSYFELFQRRALPALLLLGLGILLVVKLVLPLFSFRGRRTLVGKWRRTVRWEFWPPWVFYPPVVAWVAALGLWYRSPLLFTAANPAIDGGGFIAESKNDILRGLSAAGEVVARSTLVGYSEDRPVADRVAQVEAFLHAQELDFPLVLKPDAGQRGAGVQIVQDVDAVRLYLERARFDVIVQEFASGDEFGVFYYRYPGQRRGKIFSVTEKRLPVVVGDGVHTIGQLILRDPRAVCMAEHYAHVQAFQLGRIPAKGEAVRLVELGTHCLGAIFLDGSRIRTAALEQAIDEISRGFRGFYFGRYDLRTPDVEELKRGTGFKIVELNGVTSEATHIYDPGVGLFEAYRVLFRQWHIAFEIGRLNRERGVKPTSLSRIASLVVDYRRTSRTRS